MRALLLMVLCLSMVVYVLADDLVLGERQEGDSLILSRKVQKPAVANAVLAESVFLRSPRGEVFTYIKVANVDDSNAKFRVVLGGVGHRRAVILVIGQQGEGLNLELEAYGKGRHNHSPRPTPVPSTPVPSTPVPSTPVPDNDNNE